MKLHVIISDYGAAANIGGNVEVTAKTFDLPEEIAEYIRSRRGEWQSVMLAFEDEKESSHDSQKLLP